MSSQFFDLLRASYRSAVPHVDELGIELTRIETEGVEGILPYRPEFLGDVERGLIHTGVITTLIDSICGVALLARVGQPARVATLDLRVDYLRPSRPHKTLVCRAECYRLTEQIAFLRASVWQDDPSEPVASCLGAFMRVSQPVDPAASPVLGGALR